MRMTIMVACLAMLAGCGSSYEKKRNNSPEVKDGPGAFDADFAKSDQFFTEAGANLVGGQSPHGKVRIWYSTNLKNLLGSSEFTAPVGTVAIKEFENDNNKGLAVMIKKAKGFDSANNDWHYEMRTLKGKLLEVPAPGANGMCVSCHVAAASTDYLAGTTFY